MKKLPFLIFLITTITAIHAQTPPTVYVAGDGSGDYNCDGTSDQVEINQAIEFVVSNTDYTTVYLKGANTFWIDEPILISSNCKLLGDATAKVQVVDNAEWPENKPLLAQKGAEYWQGGANESDLGDQIYGKSSDDLVNVEIAGFELTAGNQSASTGGFYYILILLHLTENFDVHDMRLHDSYGDFVRIMGNSWTVSHDVKFYNNFMESSGHDGLYLVGISNLEAYNNEIYRTRTNDAIRFEECSGVTIHDNTIGNSLTDVASGYAGILLENDGVNLGSAEIYNNYVYGKAGGIVLESGTTKDYQNGVHIHHNKIFKTFNNTAGSADYLNGGIHIHGAHNTLIEFNTIEGSEKDGIVFEIGQGTETGYETKVQNNIISNCDNYGINNLSTDHTFVVQNNDVYNCTNGNYNNTSSSSDIYVDPLFETGITTNDPNMVDLHLKSEAGRWNGTTWVVDDVTSQCIDAGMATSDYSNEPDPNGGIVNIGAYGNTSEASKSNSGLPVELVSFTADFFENKIKLHWETATEVNNYGFNVEKKSETGNWTKVAFVEGNGNSNSPKHYTFTDYLVTSGKFFYRLKQLDINGTFKYSDVITVNLSIKTEYKLSQNYPNPFNPTTQISFTLPQKSYVKLNVYNVLGKVVAELVNQKLDAGLYNYEFDASNLTSGVYFYAITALSESSANNFYKIRKMNLIK